MIPHEVNPVNVRLLREAIANRAIDGEFLPAVYVIEPGSRCNLGCVMCPNKFMPESDLGYINKSMFENILTEISPYAEFVMLYWMGEPLLHKDFSDLLQIARRIIRGKIVVSTNMTTLTPDVEESLVNCADIVLCCIDRWSKAEYEKVRRGGNFDTVVSNTLSLIKRRRSSGQAEIVVKALDINQVSDEWADFSDFWKTNGARPMLAWLNSWAGKFPSIRTAATLPIPNSDPERTPCADLWFKMVINWKGSIQMCCFDWQYAFSIGNVEESGWLKNVWHGPQIKELRKIHAEERFSLNPKCVKCDTWGTRSEFERYVDFNEESYFTVF